MCEVTGEMFAEKRNAERYIKLNEHQQGVGGEFP